MPSIFSKNCIVAGAVDFYCLLCTKPFRSEEEAIAHIGESHHKTRLNSTDYYKQYDDDRIKKIKNLYFCEWCNITLPTAIKVGLHVGEDNHIEKKTINKITRINENIIVSDWIVIDGDSWNGLIEENCVICSVEVDDKVAHKSSQSHVLNLIRSEVLFGQHGTVYRKIDASFYQCLNCNIMLSPYELTQHFETTRHADLKKEYLKKLNCKKDTMKTQQSANTHKTENVIQNTQNGEITKTDDGKKEKKGTLPFATGMKSDGKEKTTLFTEPVLRNGKDQATRPAADELESFAKKHGLSPNRRDNSFYCKVCTRRIPATLKDLKTHVHSKGHLEKAAMNSSNTERIPTEPKKVPAGEFVKEIAFFDHNDKFRILINNKFFVDSNSIQFIGKLDDRLVCLACQIPLVPECVPQHASSIPHIEAISECLVVTSLKDEFIRQLNNGSYLCGYCSTLAPEWECMVDHLQTEEHRVGKAEAEKCMHDYKSKSRL